MQLGYKRRACGVGSQQCGCRRRWHVCVVVVVVVVAKRHRLLLLLFGEKILTIYIYTNIVVYNIIMLYVQLPPYLVFAQPRYYVRQKRTKMLGN